MGEVCNTEIWKRNKKTSKWSANEAKLEIMVELFASVRSDAFFEVKSDPFLIDAYGDKPYEENRPAKIPKRGPRYYSDDYDSDDNRPPRISKRVTRYLSPDHIDSE
jgi:hypothetical protein